MSNATQNVFPVIDASLFERICKPFNNLLGPIPEAARAGCLCLAPKLRSDSVDGMRALLDAKLCQYNGASSVKSSEDRPKVFEKVQKVVELVGDLLSLIFRIFNAIGVFGKLLE